MAGTQSERQDCCALSAERVCRAAGEAFCLVALQVSSHTITILLGLVFSVINPLVPLICVVYFGVSYLTERYNMLYSERPLYHAGGKVRQHLH